MQTQTSNTLHNAIMEAGSKDRPPMLAPGNYVQWKSRIKRYIDTKPNHELIHYCLMHPPYKLGWIDKEVPISEGSPIIRTEKFQETYKNVSQDIRDQLNTEAEAVQIILTGIDNDIYSTVDACPNACEMWKEIERIAHIANPLALVAQQQPVYNPHNHPTQYTQNSSTKSQQAATRNRGKVIVNSTQPIYDQEPSMVAEDDETSKDKETDKLMALISLSFKKIHKPTNNNLQTSSNTSRENQDNSPRINRSVGYENQRIGNVDEARETVGSTVVQKFRENMLLCKQEEAGIQLNAEQADWRDDTDDDELEDQELEAHYMYMAQLQEVSLDAADSEPIFDDEPLQKPVIPKARGKAYTIGEGDANSRSNVVTADGRIIKTNIVLRGCTIGLLGHPFNISLMPVELGSFDVIIGMNWLANNHAVIVCDEKIVRIPFGDEILIVQRDKSDKGKKSTLSIISYTKTQKYMEKGFQVFLAINYGTLS
nr:reverse transcriptase domain-containing protein [Tanacetum cinerariifolium]